MIIKNLVLTVFSHDFTLKNDCLSINHSNIIPHGPLDILQAQEQVRHRGGDRHAHRGSNPGRGRNKSHD